MEGGNICFTKEIGQHHTGRPRNIMNRQPSASVIVVALFWAILILSDGP